MTERDLVIAVVFIVLALFILLTNKLARAVVRETLAHPFRNARISTASQSGEIEVEPEDKHVSRVAPA